MTKQSPDHDHAAYMKEYHARRRYQSKSQSGSGQIAPPTYRAQLARERLAQSATEVQTVGKYFGRKA